MSPIQELYVPVPEFGPGHVNKHPNLDTGHHDQSISKYLHLCSKVEEQISKRYQPTNSEKLDGFLLGVREIDKIDGRLSLGLWK